MRKTLTIAALIALLAVPFMAVSAQDGGSRRVTLCHATEGQGQWNEVTVAVSSIADFTSRGGHGSDQDDIIPPFSVGGEDYPGKNWPRGQEILENGCEIPPPPPVPCDADDSTHRVLIRTDLGKWSDWVWDAGQQLFVRSRTVTEFWHAISDLDGKTVCARGPVQLDDEVETKEAGDVKLRIGGRCTEGGDSQEIGFVFDDGDFDGARLIITRSDGVEVANEGAGSGFFPARAAAYSYQIIWFNGQTREVLASGEFTVNKCDLPDPTPTPVPEDCSNTGDNICPGDEPPEHPPTGADPNTALAVVTSLTGFALAGIGGSILFMKRRASR